MTPTASPRPHSGAVSEAGSGCCPAPPAGPALPRGGGLSPAHAVREQRRLGAISSINPIYTRMKRVRWVRSSLSPEDVRKGVS